MGVKRMEDINTASITKLAWQLASPSHRPWTKLIKAKYFRGKQILDVQRSQITVSWIWGNILQSTKRLRDEACYQIGANSDQYIKWTPGLITLHDFRIPMEIDFPPGITRIKHIMDNEGKIWNTDLVTTIFPIH